MYKIHTDIQQLDTKKWADFVLAHPNGNIFQTPEMVELYLATPKFEPLVIACLDEKGEYAGVLVSVIQQEYNGILGKVSARSIVWGGPLIKDHDTSILNLILNEYDKKCRKTALFSQFRNLWEMNSFKEHFVKNNYLYEEHLDILFDLKKGSDSLWNEMSSTRRKQIKKGLRSEVDIEVKDSLNEQELAQCYLILSKVYGKIKLPFPDIGFFRNSINILSGKKYFEAVLAYFQGEIIGFRFFLVYKGLLYDWYAGSLENHYDKYPNDILPWEILKWGADSGHEVFDFGGAGKPGVPYGVRDYKLKFGGDLVNFGRFEKIHKPFLMSMARIGFKAWKAIKR